MVSIRSNLMKNIAWLQWIAAMGSMLMIFTVGLMSGWTSPFLAKLTAANSPIPLTTEEASWVASLLNFGRFLGAVIGGIIVQNFGSKRTLVVVGFPLMLGWICIIMANSVLWLYVARIAAGISLGMSYSSFPIYLGEVASPKIRGALVSLAISGLTLGTTVGNIMGTYVSMTLFGYISIVPNFVFISLFIWIPESPHYLVRMGKIEDAKKSMVRYDPKVDAKIGVESLKDFISASESITFLDRLRELNLPRNRKAGFICIMLYFFMHFCGVNSLVFYQEIVLTTAKLTIITPATLVVISSVAGVVSGWISVYIADKFRRKVLMIFSCIGVGVSMAAFGTHFFLLQNGFDSDALQWLPITVMLVFTFFSCNGIITVPNMIVSELFAPNIKNLAACLTSILVGLYAFISSRSFQPLIDAIGEPFVFWLHTILMVLAIIFAAIFMPETKGKSLQQIQDELMRK